MRFAYSLVLIAGVFAGNLVAQAVRPKEVVIVEFSIRRTSHRLEVPINRQPNVNDGVGFMSITECLFCLTEEDWARAEPTSTWTAQARAYRLGGGRANVAVQVIVDDECKSGRVLKVSRIRKTTTSLRCGVNVAAYFGLEGETSVDDNDASDIQSSVFIPSFSIERHPTSQSTP
jgi:hypothetical protein